MLRSIRIILFLQLEQYIACCNKYSVTPVIEIKSIRTEEAMNLFMQLLTESQKEPVLICFRIETLGKLREMGLQEKCSGSVQCA